MLIGTQNQSHVHTRTLGLNINKQNSKTISQTLINNSRTDISERRFGVSICPISLYTRVNSSNFHSSHGSLSTSARWWEYYEKITEISREDIDLWMKYDNAITQEERDIIRAKRNEVLERFEQVARAQTRHSFAEMDRKGDVIREKLNLTDGQINRTVRSTFPRFYTIHLFQSSAGDKFIFELENGQILFAPADIEWYDFLYQLRFVHGISLASPTGELINNRGLRSIIEEILGEVLSSF